MSNALLNFLKKYSGPKKKPKKVDRQKIQKTIAKSGTPIGRIAKERLKHDKALKDIMDSI